MRKGIKILIVLTTVLFALQPITQALNCANNSNVQNPIQNDTITTACFVIGADRSSEKKIVELTREEYNNIIDLGKSLFEDFIVIYDPESTTGEVDVAFNNVKPFFTTIVDHGLTDKSVEELKIIYKEIRQKIIDGREKKGGKIQSTGWWNGLWAPAFVNGGCGIFAEAKRCQGFVIGTHSIFPSIGFDILLTYFTTDLSAMTGTIGVTGVTNANGPQMAFIINYLGILFGEIPVVSYMVFALLIGYAMFYAGASIY